MIKTILITGGTGLVGEKLVEMLLHRGYKIHLLTRGNSKSLRTDVRTFKWDIYKREIDKQCIAGVDAIIHLAGEEIGSNRWTGDRKQQIIESRTESIRMIYDLIRKTKNQVGHIISASAIGFYGARGGELLSEDSLPGKDFLAETCIEWEQAVDEGLELGLRIVKLRCGIILDAKGGALNQMTKPLKMGFGTILGSGTQWVSWIHIRDALDMYIFALENEKMKGVYNAAAPDAVSNTNMTHAIAAAMHISVWFFHVPEFVLKLAMGEMSILALGSSRVSPDKVIREGFEFAYPNIEGALNEIYSNQT